MKRAPSMRMLWIGLFLGILAGPFVPADNLGIGRAAAPSSESRSGFAPTGEKIIVVDARTTHT